MRRLVLAAVAVLALLVAVGLARRSRPEPPAASVIPYQFVARVSTVVSFSLLVVDSGCEALQPSR